MPAPTNPPPVNTNPSLPTGGGPVAFDRDAAVRTREAVKFVERMYRGRPRRGEGPSALASGAWAYLASGTLGGISGGTLGSGTVQLCSRSGATLTADGPNVTAYNAGGDITGPAYLQLAWTDGDWGVVVAACP